MKLGIIGVGNMGGAILKGILKSASICASDIIIYNRSIDKVQEFVDAGVSYLKDEVEVAKNSDILLLAIKPQGFKNLALKIKDSIMENSLVVSIAAGISIDFLKENFGDNSYVRVMPNTPALIGQGMTAICPDENIDGEKFDKVVEIFQSIGKTAIIEENKIDAFSGVSGCMPAFVYMFIEAAADAAVSNGIKREDAYKYVSETLVGAANMVLETGLHPGQLKDQVCSPAGSTIRGVLALEKEGFRNAITNAVNESSNFKIELE